MHTDSLTACLGIQGFTISDIRTDVRKRRSVAIVELERTRTGYVCGGCGRAVAHGYDGSWHEIQHLQLWHHPTILRFRRYRVECPTCGVRTEALDFVGIRGPQVTTRLAALVHEMCKVMTVKAVAIFHGMHRGTVKAIDKALLEKTQSARPLDGITALGADEIAVGQGHHYWHMISALAGPRGSEMLYCGEGRKERHLKGFWTWFGEDRARRIRYGVMDMWKPFRNSFRAHCPGIAIIYDKFHVIRHLLDALNDVRKEQMRKAARKFRGLLAGKKFVLLKRHARVLGRSREALGELLAVSPKLLKAHALKELFPHIWSYKSKTWARKFFDGWVRELRWSRMEPFKKFARMVEDHFDGITAHRDAGVPLGFIESANLKARNAIRMAYGYRDDAYMKLKVIQACTPWMRRFHPWEITHSIPS